MARINLLPWREQQREERKREFFIALAVSAAAAIFLLFITHLVMAGKINSQKHRNSYLNKEIKVLDEQISEIKELKKQKEALLTRMSIIQELQLNRSKIVHLFDELVNILPQGVYLSKVKRTGNGVLVHGFAESNTNISKLMRSIDASKWLAKPVLNKIKTEKIKGKYTSEFNLKLLLIQPREKKSKKNEKVKG